MSINLKKITGLKNLGNTCYLNSGLQLIFNCLLFNKLILKNDFENKFLFGLKKTLIDYFNSDVTKLGPVIIKNILSNNYEQFNNSEQGDCNEFLICLIELVEKNCKNLEYNLYENINNNNLIELLFDCKIKSIITCLKTNETFTKNESEKLLSFPIPKKENITLDDCYNEFTKIEYLNNDNQYYNEKINEYVDAKKNIKITNYPKYLFISLKRFNNFMSKNNEKIKIDLNYNFNNTNYHLIGFVIHIGNIYNGHYISLILKNNKWYLCDDDNIQEVENIENYLYHSYILLYTHD